MARIIDKKKPLILQAVFNTNTEERMGPPTKWDDPEYIKRLEKLEQEREALKLPIIEASSIITQPVRWIYDHWLAEEELTVLAGPPGAGKTTFACAIATGITKGNGYQLHPGFKVNGNGHVLFINNEDSMHSTLLPRLIAAGANLDFVHFISTRTRKNGETPFSFKNERDVNRLIGINRTLVNNIGLIVVDPIYFAVDGDHGNNFKARQAYEGLASLAKILGCAVLGIAHTVRNPSGKEPLARIFGPSALREVPRGIMLLNNIVSGPTANGGTHVLVHAKNSLGKIDGGFEYCLQELDIADPNSPLKGLKFTITDEKFGSAEDILKEADRPKPVETANKTELAKEFLQTILKSGPKLFIEIDELAKKAGVTNGTLQLAKSNLNIETKRRNGDGRSVWSLPNLEIGNAIVEPISGDEMQATPIQQPESVTPQGG